MELFLHDFNNLQQGPIRLKAKGFCHSAAMSFIKRIHFCSKVAFYQGCSSHDSLNRYLSWRYFLNMVLPDVEVNTKTKLRMCPAFFIKVFYTSVMWSYWGNYQFHIWPFMCHINVVVKKVITVFKTRPLLFHVISVF